ncbi:hypothetical protein X759_30170 [Mesorhizobium sp. LSHC420B00]|nr:hypothetical protein X759_30170 [Mesorhizobium sp. LSHC420B00]
MTSSSQRAKRRANTPAIAKASPLPPATLDDGAAGCKRLGHDKGENAHDIVVAQRQEAREHAGDSKGVAIAAGDHAILIR